jgi:hypothetical protein
VNVLKIMNLKSKLFAGVVTIAMVLGAAVPASAQTAAELTAQINSLLAMINQLQAQLSAQGGGSTGGTGAGMMFTSDLTVGSRGPEVTALQQWLVSKGYLVMPAGVSYGYFGNLTKMALAKYQAEAGISPASGYFGPITRARINAMASVQTMPTMPTMPTIPTTPTTPSNGITTPGVEGTLTVTSSNSGVASTVYEGDSMVAVLGFKAEAKTSDIAIQRVKLDLGNSTKIFNKIYSKVYLTEGSNVIASSDLNSSTVVKEGSKYYITLSGFNYVVPKNTTKNLLIKVDLRPSIDSTDLTSYTMQLADNGVRGVDGAGIDQYSPTTGSTVSKSVSVAANLADSATLKVALNTSSPKKKDVVASSGSNKDELDKLTTLVFDVKAEKDNVKITDLVIGVAKTGGGAANASSTAYIFEGSTELDNASVSSSGYANFTDFNYVVPKDTTRTLTVKVDIKTANATVANFVTTASSTGMLAENTAGDSLSSSSKTGTATGYSIGVRNIAPEVTLVSKSIVTNGAPQTSGVNNISTSTLTATFNVKVKALGGDIMFGTAASGTPMFGTSNTFFKVYRNGADSGVSSYATSTSYSIPSGVTTAGLTNSFTLSEGNEVTIPVTFQIVGREAAAPLTSGLYSVGLEGIAYQVVGGAAGTISFMAGETDWRTSDVSFP